MTMYAPVEVTSLSLDLYSETGITPNTAVKMQNTGPYNVHVYSGATPPGDQTKYFVLKPMAPIEIFQDVEIYVWSPASGQFTTLQCET